MVGQLDRKDLSVPAPSADGTSIGTNANGGLVQIDYTGVLVLIGPQPLTYSGGVQTGSRAGVRARVELLDADQTVLGTVWRGYVKAGGNKPSVPGVPVQQGQFLRISAAGSIDISGLANRVQFRAYIDPAASPFAGTIVDEPLGPASGPGDMHTFNLGDPAANVDYAGVTVGAQSIHKVRLGRFLVTAKVNVGGLVLDIYDAAAVMVSEVVAILEVGAGGTNTIVAAPGPASKSPTTAITAAASRSPIPVPEEIVMFPAQSWQFIRDNPNAGDNLGQGYAVAEVWATDP